MNRFRTATFAAIALLCAGVGAASAAQPVEYRAEVYPAAQIRARDAAQAAPAATRAQVRAELDAARRSGELVVGDAGLKQNEVFASRYPRGEAAAAKTAEEIRAERVAARPAGIAAPQYVN
jgi:hypothetical protein